MHNEKQDWGKAYQQIADLITTKVPEIKHVDLYHQQEMLIDDEGNWIPFQCPAVFLEFTFTPEDIGERRQLLNTEVTVRLAYETLSDSNKGSMGQERALKFIELMRKIHEALHCAEGDDFGPMSRTGQAKHEAPPYMIMWSQTYSTIILDYSATQRYGEMEDVPLQIEQGGGPAPAPSKLVVVRNSDGTYRVELEPGEEHVLPNVTHTNSDGLPVTLPAMTPFVATACPASPPPGIARLRQTGGAQIGGDIPVASGAIVPITAPNGAVSIRNSQDSEVAQAFPMSGQSIIASVPDGSAVILDSTDVPIGSPLAVPSAAAPTRTIADSQITRPDGTIVGLRATQPLDVRSYRSGIRYAVNFGMWSGTEAVYQTGDEGAMYASGFFDYIGPVYALHVARLVDWFTLFDPNVFGNTNRFTDRSGLQVYPNRIIVDHYTGLEWYSPTTALNGTWTAAISAGVALNYQGNTDWRVPPLGVLQTIIRNVTGVLLNYAPFSIPAGTIWSSTTNVSSTTNALPMISSGAFQSTAKSGSARYFFVRRWAA